MEKNITRIRYVTLQVTDAGTMKPRESKFKYVPHGFPTSNTTHVMMFILVHITAKALVGE